MTSIRSRLAVLVTLMVAIVGVGVGVNSTAAARDHANAHATSTQKTIGQVFCQNSANCTLPGFDFNNAFDTHTYTVWMGKAGTRLTADTMDCCIAGDHWGVVLNRFGGSGVPIAAACGNGSTSAFSGAASLSGAWMKNRVVQVTVIHCSGVSTFPAGLTLRLAANAPIQTVTQKSGQG